MGGVQSSVNDMSTIDYDSYPGPRSTKVVPNSNEPNRGPIYYTETALVYEKTNTIYHNFQQAVAREHGTRRLYGTRHLNRETGEYGEYEWVTYGEVSLRVDALASGLVKACQLQRHSVVGIMSKNRYEWALVAHSCDRQALISVPLYDTLGPDAIPYIMNHTECTVLCIAKEQFGTLLKCIDKCPQLKLVIQFEQVTTEEREVAQQHQFELKSLWEIEMLGRQHPIPADPPLSTDIATICYTSGTTGDPKGVMLTHANFMSAAVFGTARLRTQPDDIHLSFLPLAHIYERAVHIGLIYAGGSIGFYQGDVLKLLDDCAVLQPTLFVAVPRLFNRIYDKVKSGAEAAGGIKKVLFNAAVASKVAYLEDGGHKTHALWDALVFAKIRMLLGGRVRFFLSGSAPLSTEVKRFFKIAFSCELCEGYGLTESTAGVLVNEIDAPVGSNVGTPITNMQVRLEDVPDMNYFSTDRPRPRGEVLLKGGSVFVGYYKDPEKTREVLDEDGWFHTGDIGCWNADGTLSIIDRKKNIFKLSQGEYVAAEKIENIYMHCKYIAQIFVYGDSLKDKLVAIVVPDPEIAEQWAKENGASPALKDIVSNPEFHKQVGLDMKKIAQDAELRGFEHVKHFLLHPDLFSVDNGLLTPTFKLKRNALKVHFERELDQLYQQLG